MMQKSPLWRHFTKKGPDMRVSCLYCNQQLSVANKSTCSLIRHLSKKHPEVPVRRHSAAEGQQSLKEEILLVNNDDTDTNCESPESPILEYEIEELIEESEVEAEEMNTSKPDPHPRAEIPRPSLRIVRSKRARNSKQMPVEQQVIGAMSEAKKQIGDALFSMRSINRRKSDDKDEYDHFGHVIASKIRKIQDMDKREVVMHSMYDIVYQALMKNI